MTQSPQSGQAARSTDVGAHSASRRSSFGDTDSFATPEPWTAPAKATSANASSTTAQNPAYGAPVHADAPTGTMPPVDSEHSSDSRSSSTAAPARDVAGSSTGGATRPAGQQRRGARSRGPRRARLQLRHINPWTVLKFSCVLSIALFFVWLIVVGVLFGVLDAAGIIGKINDTVVQLNGTGSSPPITAGIVFGGAAIIGVVNIVLFIALSTIGSIVYNLCADLVGGIEVTLSER